MPFFSTHPDIDQITDMMRKDPALKNGFSIYANIPYIVKYISVVNTTINNVTLNLPAFSKLLEKADINQTLVMTVRNKKGFLMNPGNRQYEKIVKNAKHSILAMATLASGALKPREAYGYLSKIGITHVIVDLSSREHAVETFGMINCCILQK